MTRLTLVVGQRRSVLVAGALLIVACGDDGAAPRVTNDATAAAPDAVPASAPFDAPDAAAVKADAAAASADAAAASPDAAAQPPDAGADAYKPASRDAAALDAAAWPDAAYLPGGGPPPPWVGKDIGMVARAGDTTAMPSSFTVVAGGADIGGTADSFHFVHQSLMGDGEIIARVAALNGGEP